jgi:hypothetical protein
VKKKYIWDIESKSLLNSDWVDYNASPYKLKDDRFVHCVGFKDKKTKEKTVFLTDDIYNGRVKEFILDTAEELIGHNTINFDHLVMKSAIGLDYTIGYFDEPDTICGQPIIITDTLVMSKTLNPDRPQHSIDYFGGLLGLEKIDWRAEAIELGLITVADPKGAEFRVFHPRMVPYMERDLDVNDRVHDFLLREWGTWAWERPYQLEKLVKELITRQEHRGFWFNRDKAVEHVKVLDDKMEKLRAIVEPLIPAKPLTKTAMKDYTPPAKQFKKDTTPNAHITNFAEKHGGKIEEVDGVYRVELYGVMHTLPLPPAPIFTHMPATIKDTTHIKGWLVEMGWNPTAFKERDLTVDSKKKKQTKEKFDAAIDKWVDQTFDGPFKEDRMTELADVRGLGITLYHSREMVKHRLKEHDHMKRPLKVYTNPTLTVGVEKEIDPALLGEAMQAKFKYAKEVSEYLTFSHRRNSILGGNVDPDDEEADMEKGWLAVDRINHDHRIPTPADTCGAATTRFKHRLVANIPRVTSLFGEELRELFGVDVLAGFMQMGYDFASLEAMIESHYCWRYDDEDKSYCRSLVGEKPNDVHTLTATKISAAIGKAFGRTPAKTVKYCCAYGGQPARVAKTIGCDIATGKLIYEAYWDAARPLLLLAEKLKAFWERMDDKGGCKKFILGVDGRKIPTRSASALINSLFQSAGVICAKLAMVLHDRKMRAEGLTVDFWTDDWKAKKFVQQLIAYHDEGQLEMHKSMIQWKLFPVSGDFEMTNEKLEKVPTPEAEAAKKAAKEFKKAQDKPWSEIAQSDKGFYLGYCRAGELVVEAVRETSEHFKLNVTLSADYILGRNWAECH